MVKEETDFNSEPTKKDIRLQLSILIALSASILTGLAYNVYAIIQPIIFDNEPSWELNAARSGELLSSMVLLFAGAGLIAGYYVDKISKKPVAIIGGTLTGISCILAGIAPNWNIFFLSQVLIALGNGIISPVIFSLIADITPPEKRSTNYGLVIFFGLFGGLLGGVLFLGFIVFNEWRLPYMITGLITLILSLCLFLIKLPKRGAKEHALEDVLRDEDANYDYYIELKDIPDIMKRKSNTILLLNFADALPSGVFLLATLWLTEEHNVSLGIAGIFLILLLLMRFMAPPVWGKVADKVHERTQDPLSKLKICITLLISYSPLFIIAVLLPWRAPDGANLGELILTPNFIPFIILLLVAFFISAGTQPIWQSAISEINFPEHRATAYQLANFVDQVGIAIGVFIAGYLVVWFAPNGYIVAFLFAAIAGGINIITWIIALRFYEEDKNFVDRVLAERAEEIKIKTELRQKSE